MSCVMTTAPIPVVFIHGLWLHATSWQPWLALFREAGYDPAIAAGWPREPDTVEQARTQPRPGRQHRHRRRHPPVRRHHRQARDRCGNHRRRRRVAPMNLPAMNAPASTGE
jgi:hypothetical protein